MKSLLKLRFPLSVALPLLCGLGSVQATERLPEQVFRSTCIYCHGHMIAPGVAVAPELRGRKLSPDIVATFVRNGSARMLAFRTADISDTELQALGRWIQDSAAPTAPGAQK